MSSVESSDARIPYSVTCIGCRYNLRGLRFSDLCPECRTSIVASLRALRLCFVAPDWLGRWARGAWWVAALPMLVILVVLVFYGGYLFIEHVLNSVARDAEPAADVAGASTTPGFSVPEWLTNTLEPVFKIGFLSVWLAAVRLATHTPATGHWTDRAASRAARLARSMAVLTLIFAALGGGLGLAWSAFTAPPRWTATLSLAFGELENIGQMLCIYGLFGWWLGLTRRIPASRWSAALVYLRVVVLLLLGLTTGLSALVWLDLRFLLPALSWMQAYLLVSVLQILPLVLVIGVAWLMAGRLRRVQAEARLRRDELAEATAQPVAAQQRAQGGKRP